VHKLLVTFVVLELLRNKDNVEADAQEYENKVLNLELKSLLDRYRMLDVEVTLPGLNYVPYYLALYHLSQG
jgi:hypothetical protein